MILYRLGSLHFLLRNNFRFFFIGQDKVFKGKSRKLQGFTLIEILIVISIIILVSMIVLSLIGDQNDKAKLGVASSNLQSIATAAQSYLTSRGRYPADENRDIPGELQNEMLTGTFKSSPWKGSIYDWDNWIDPITGKKIIQISIRFCDFVNEHCKFPKADWAQDFDYHSSVYYCLEGACRSHISRPISHPGYCVNCK